MAIARMMVGKAMKTSVTRINSSSHIPPAYPATAPTSVPISVETTMTSSPAGRETRPPYSTRVSTSRPSWSVPIRLAGLGGCRRLAMFCSSGP